MDKGAIMKFKKWDFNYFLQVDWWYGFIHLIGSGLITVGLFRLGLSWWSMIITFGLGLLWECLDGLLGKVLSIFDNSGFSWRDIIYDTAGIILTGLTILILII